MPERIWECFEC